MAITRPGTNYIPGAGIAIGLADNPGLNAADVTISATGGGTGGGDKNYVHTQSTLASSWSVAHGLGKFPAVEVVDSGGSILIPDVQYIDVNTVTIIFASATSGKAYLN